MQMFVCKEAVFNNEHRIEGRHELILERQFRLNFEKKK